MALNDHADWGWDERMLGTLASAATASGLPCARLTGALARFGGYAERLATPGIPRGPDA